MSWVVQGSGTWQQGSIRSNSSRQRQGHGHDKGREALETEGRPKVKVDQVGQGIDGKSHGRMESVSHSVITR